MERTRRARLARRERGPRCRSARCTRRRPSSSSGSSGTKRSQGCRAGTAMAEETPRPETRAPAGTKRPMLQAADPARKRRLVRTGLPAGAEEAGAGGTVSTLRLEASGPAACLSSCLSSCVPGACREGPFPARKRARRTRTLPVSQRSEARKTRIMAMKAQICSCRIQAGTSGPAMEPKRVCCMLYICEMTRGRSMSGTRSTRGRPVRQALKASQRPGMMGRRSRAGMGRGGILVKTEGKCHRRSSGNCAEKWQLVQAKKWCLHQG